MTHNNLNLPQYFAVETTNEAEYQQIKNWFDEHGLSPSPTFSKLFVPEGSTKAIGILSARMDPRHTDTYNNYATGDWYRENIPVFSFIEFQRKSKGCGKSDGAIGVIVPTKKIIGYKLLKDYPTVPESLRKSKEIVLTFSGVTAYVKGESRDYSSALLLTHWGVENTEFWEPIYEEEFKAGDWVTFIRPNDSEKITGMVKDPHYSRESILLDTGDRPVKGYVRHATPEEIEAASKTILKLGSGITTRTFDIRKNIIAVFDCSGNALQIEPELFHSFVYPRWGKYELEVTISANGTKLSHKEIRIIWEAYVKHTPDWKDKIK